MTIITSFEVISQPLVPKVTKFYVEQGFFLQVSNLRSSVALIQSLSFTRCPIFDEESDDKTIKLFANIIDANGNVIQITPKLFKDISGFPLVEIPGNSTIIFGVQYTRVEISSGGIQDAQDGIARRGTVELTLGPAPEKASLLLLATHRQVFTNVTDIPILTVVSEAAYSLPIVGGPVFPA